MKYFLYLISAFLVVSIIGCSGDKEKAMLKSIAQMEMYQQDANLNQFERGSSFRYSLVEELNTLPKHDGYFSISNKIRKTLDFVDEIERKTDYIIKRIDSLKLALLCNASNLISISKEGNSNSNVWLSENYYKEQPIPLYLNIPAVHNQNNFNVSTALFCTNDPMVPSETGMKLWKDLLNYRKGIMILAQQYLLKIKNRKNIPSINEFVDKEDLNKKVEKMLTICFPKLPEDVSSLEQVYTQLTKAKFLLDSDHEKSHWIHSTFYGASLLGAIAALSALQNDILKARSTILGHLSSKFGSCNYDFDRIIPYASGPFTAKEGEEIKLKVIMAAYDSYNTPTVTANLKDARYHYPMDGTGIVSFKAKKGLQTIRGTITIKNKSGVAKTENWEWTINVLDK